MSLVRVRIRNYADGPPTWVYDPPDPPGRAVVGITREMLERLLAGAYDRGYIDADNGKDPNPCPRHHLPTPPAPAPTPEPPTTAPTPGPSDTAPSGTPPG